MATVSLTVNGKVMSAEASADTLFVNFIRENLGMTGTHVGCDTSHCGACVVMVNGDSVKSCTMLAVQAEGAEVTTVGFGFQWRPSPHAAGISRQSRFAMWVLYTRYVDQFY